MQVHPIKSALASSPSSRQIAVDIDEKTQTIDPKQLPPGVYLFDPGFTSTASCESAVTFIDGDRGILRYRGFPIEQLAQGSNFFEVSYLLVNGNLPCSKSLANFQDSVTPHATLPASVANIISSFPPSTHPMTILVSSVAALSGVFPEASPLIYGNDVHSKATDQFIQRQISRVLALVPIISAAANRHTKNLSFLSNPLLSPSKHSYAQSFMSMIFPQQYDALMKGQLSPQQQKRMETVARALDVIFILHADHEQNCSTSTMRQLTSANADVYTSLSAAIGALSGPLHGGATEAALGMLQEIGVPENIDAFLVNVKNGKQKLMGFGHRVYKNYDPRAKLLRDIAHQLFNELNEWDPLIEVAKKLEATALSDEYFIKRKLYPNVDFYSGLIYKVAGFKGDFFPVLFAVARTIGWMAHWKEFLRDPNNKIFRPRQVYIGQDERKFVQMSERVPRQAKL